MVKHVVMWNIQEGLNKQEVVKKLKEELEGLPGKIECLISLDLGAHFNKTATGRDVVLYSEFETLDDLQKYLVHPDHVKAADYVKSVVCDRVDVDYEI